jgi:hypothetical protein
MWKALSVIAAILAAGAAFLSYLNKGDVEKERELLATSKSNFADITARNKEVLTAQEDILRKNKAMEARRDVALEEQEAEKQKLETKTQEVADANARIKELEMEIASAKAKIAEFGNIAQLKALIDQLQTDIFTAKNEIATLETQLASTKTREEQTAERIQNYKDLEFRQRNGQMTSINANIASVYNGWGFAILDAGDRQGVVSRTKLDVKRGGEKIGELVVTNLERNRSVCDIVPGSMEPGQMLRPGDRVSVSDESLPKPKAAPDPNAVVVPGDAAIPDATAIPGEAPEMDPTSGFPAGDADPFSDLDAPATTPTTPTTPATPPANDDPFSDL